MPHCIRQEDRVLQMLRSTPGLVANEMLARVLGNAPRANDRRSLAYAVSRTRKILRSDESIKNCREFGYQIITHHQPRAS